MEKLLFVSILIVAVVGITSRYHLNKLKTNLTEDEVSESFSEKLKEKNTQNTLSQAFTQVMDPKPNFTPPKATPAPTQNLSEEVAKVTQEIQNDSPDSPSAFEKGLSLTSAPENEQFRLTVLQAAAVLTGDNSVVRNAAMGAAMATPGQTPLDRDVVSAAYRVYLQTAIDPMLTYNDTVQILNTQTDTATKSKIIFDCVNKFPQLREQFH